jgi:acyl-coenzyme A synthetase/AMP-(fatty) acid ligase
MIYLVTDKKSESYSSLLYKINEGLCDCFFTSFVSDLVSNSDIDLLNYTISKKKNKIANLLELKSKIVNSKSRIRFNTSGTTGNPKKITHDVSFLLNKAKKFPKSCVWLYTYNKLHMGGVQVLLQALINNDAIIDGYKKDRDYIFNVMKKYEVTNISATPTFYKLLLPFEEQFTKVKRITVGGERTDDKTIEIINEMFPNAKVNNIYATTEHGAVLFSRNNVFKINDKIMIKGGVLLVRTGKNIHYNTGDLVKMINETEFVFIGRNTEIVNIGGRNVNPSQIEDIITKHPQVSQAVVYAKNNKLLGNILACKIVSTEITESEIKTYLKERIKEDYKIPRIINLVDSVLVNKNNKAIR